ncbi:putative circadian clock protein, KaiC [Thermocrinis albus DSM 14484]|uniref:Putative circadian clock protein, KaiC n=1 Tax=Thermocrinis albus (strain DSM 14484 / JCM 11386 / HI 11/12) TaxID=638303 RepID=D3SL77_THEAH|nr:KaiC domain-containing protein [Thermocrinis albus]ADC89507.1 putative circadian clock protein, KaiC [Thermocrinis albus DSM 14484]
MMEEKEKPQIVEESIWIAGEAIKKAPRLQGVPTGVEGLDDLFFVAELVDGKIIKKPLGGIPAYSVTNITGVSDTGKSLMVEQYAVMQASRGEGVAFITVESPAPFVTVGLRERAKAMGIDWDSIQDRIVLIDAASHGRLRENLPDLFATLAYAIKTYKVRHTIIDSVTGLYEAKEMMARTIVRQLFNFMKKWYQTALFVSQKRSGHEELTAEAAGGYAVSHIVDCSIVLSKELILTQTQARIYKKQIGDVVRLFRIDGCRMCGHDTRTHFMEITELGLVKIGPPITGG